MYCLGQNLETGLGILGYTIRLSLVVMAVVYKAHNFKI